MTKEELESLILDVNERTKISPDILEKDYYVCLILKELSQKQDSLKAYFKGGTAIYKIMDTMNRFSEDIDLTVKVVETDSKTSNVNRLKKSALDYHVDSLELVKNETEDKKGSITAFYKYETLFADSNLFKKSRIQIESTSFTVSEPTKVYSIEPLIYKFATNEQKDILKNTFGISEFNIEIIKLERIFIDKVFATEFYYIRHEYQDVSKHLYDITFLLKNEDIRRMLNNKNELLKLISYKRKEEMARIGGIDSNLKIKNFKYLNEKLDKNVQEKFNIMQETYVFDDKYKISFKEVKNTIEELKKYFQ